MADLMIQKIEVDTTHPDKKNVAAKRSRLVAQWIVVEGKLVCQWSVEYE